MNVKSSRFGDIEISKDDVIVIEKGLFGFSGKHKFVILESEETVPFKWLQSVECSDLAFVIVEPHRFCPEYKIKLNSEDREELRLYDDEKMRVYVLVVIPSEPRKMTANMLGPIVFNSEYNCAKQVVFNDEHYTARHYLLS